MSIADLSWPTVGKLTNSGRRTREENTPCAAVIAAALLRGEWLDFRSKRKRERERPPRPRANVQQKKVLKRLIEKMGVKKMNRRTLKPIKFEPTSGSTQAQVGTHTMAWPMVAAIKKDANVRSFWTKMGLCSKLIESNIENRINTHTHTSEEKMNRFLSFPIGKTNVSRSVCLIYVCVCLCVV